MFPVILGSQSPRRKDIFDFFSIPHMQATPPFDESSIPFNGNPEEYVCKLSDGKALSLSHSYRKYPIITADTIVCKDNVIYGKPSSLGHAHQMLKELEGSWHRVLTGITLWHKGQLHHLSEESSVLLNPLTEEQITRYHQSIKWSDKAGAYAIQTTGSLLVKRIEGCYYNVMGLPINTLCQLFSIIGIDLWDYLPR